MGQDITREQSVMRQQQEARDLASVVLPAPEPTIYNYDPITVHGKMAYLAGQIPKKDGKLVITGIVGADVDLKQAQKAAVICADQALSWLAHSAGGLENIDRVLRADCFIAHADGFADISNIADAASGRLIDVLGPRGRHSRSVLGIKSLPRNSPVLLEVTVALKNSID